MLDRGESPDLVAILREEYAIEPRAAYERALRAIAETAAGGLRPGSDGEDAVDRWARSVRAGPSLYLALGDAISWLRDNSADSGSEAQASMLF